MTWTKQKQTGFTIVELLIVVVVIAILAAITVVAYGGIQGQTRQAKIKADISQLEKAILAARNNQGGIALRYITNSTATGSGCWGKPDGTNLATLPTSDGCWTRYVLTLDAISTASSINVRNLIDPWGRPYYIDENEDESCTPDHIGYYAQPFTTGQTMIRQAIQRTKAC